MVIGDCESQLFAAATLHGPGVYNSAVFRLTPTTSPMAVKTTTLPCTSFMWRFRDDSALEFLHLNDFAHAVVADEAVPDRLLFDAVI
jgi:hypothetical protein